MSGFTEIIPPSGYGSREWHEARRKGVSASDIAAIMGIPGAYQSAFTVYWRKVLGSEEAGSDRMDAGHWLESSVVDWWRDQQDWEDIIDVDRCGLLQRNDSPTELATPDQLIYPADPYSRQIEPLEVKTSNTYEGWGPDGSDQIPAHYRAQVLWQMNVTGAGRGHAAVLFGAPFGFRRYVLERTDAVEAEIQRMREAAAGFMDAIATESHPPLSGHRSELGVLKELNPDYVADSEIELDPFLTGEWRVAAGSVREWTSCRDALRDQIRLAMGSAQIGTVDGEPVVSRSITEIKPGTRKGFTRDALYARGSEGDDDE